MKVRWTKSSLRVRITPSELNALLAGEGVLEELKFPGAARWNVVLEVGAAATSLNSGAATVSLQLSTSDLIRLNDPATQGVYFSAPAGGEIRYCVEKDLPCVHPRPMEANEPETETFMPPG